MTLPSEKQAGIAFAGVRAAKALFPLIPGSVSCVLVYVFDGTVPFLGVGLLVVSHLSYPCHTHTHTHTNSPCSPFLCPSVLPPWAAHFFSPSSVNFLSFWPCYVSFKACSQWSSVSPCTRLGSSVHPGALALTVPASSCPQGLVLILYWQHW